MKKNELTFSMKYVIKKYLNYYELLIKLDIQRIITLKLYLKKTYFN